jgi:hypothetical protein
LKSGGYRIHLKNTAAMKGDDFLWAVLCGFDVFPSGFPCGWLAVGEIRPWDSSQATALLQTRAVSKPKLLF